MPRTPPLGAERPPFVGAGYALLAYGSWGVLPVFWKSLASVPTGEILAHRVVGALLFSGLLLSVAGRWGELRQTLGTPRQGGALLATALLIGSNWFVFIWAVNHDRLLDASLGYYLNPLVNVLLGTLWLGERLRRPQIAAVLIAALGVTSLVVDTGGLPWVSLYLALSFARYGLLRKLAPARPLMGLAVETALLTPAALIYLVALEAGGRASLGHSGAWINTLLLLTGAATALPLLWFASAAKRLRLSTLGLFQYLAPSLSFLLAVAVYDEPFAANRAITFGCIWLALFVYTADSLRVTRAGRPA